jgi:hypothetical protein
LGVLIPSISKAMGADVTHMGPPAIDLGTTHVIPESKDFGQAGDGWRYAVAELCGVATRCMVIPKKEEYVHKCEWHS